MYYFGLLTNTRRVEVFYSKIKPTNKTHGHLYSYVFGGYKTKKETIEKAKFQYSYVNVVAIDNRKKRNLETDRAISKILSDR